jgi:hypothetical protein
MQSPQHQPQSNQTTAPQSLRSHHDLMVEMQAGLNNDSNDDPMVGDGDANMVDAEDMAVDNEEDEYFPQESQLPSDDIYATPPQSRRLYRKYVHESDYDDQPQQPKSPQLRPEGCITYSIY